MEKNTHINKHKPCVDEADCEHFKALLGMSRISDRLERRSRSPSEVHHNTQMTCLKEDSFL